MAELISEKYKQWEAECDQRFNKLRANEEELNRIFIDIYGLGAELSPEVAEHDVTVRKANLQREVHSLISYAVGCLFGRYSVDCDGLCCTGSVPDPDKYRTIIPVADNIIPVRGGAPEDSLTEQIICFVRAVYGEETLDENLEFIADALGGDGTPREIIDRYLVRDFYRDHCRIYRKRPIYWLFSSGKKHGFSCLVYIHRFSMQTLPLIREKYTAAALKRYQAQISEFDEALRCAPPSERQVLRRQRGKLTLKLEETADFSERLRTFAESPVSIDLNDGIKANYAKFQSILERIY